MAAVNRAEDDLRPSDWSFREAEMQVLFMEAMLVGCGGYLGEEAISGNKILSFAAGDLREPLHGCQ